MVYFVVEKLLKVRLSVNFIGHLGGHGNSSRDLLAQLKSHA